ncbi:MAG: ABC transporter permease [Ginsengibacter sp.]
MIKSYLKIALRNLQRNKLYSIINIGGLAVGMAVSIILLLFVVYELTYDRFHLRANNIYQVMRHQSTEGDINTTPATPVPLAAALQKDVPEVQIAVRSSWPWDHLLNTNGKAIRQPGMYVDPGFLQMFSFPLIKGAASSVLSDISSIVFTQSAAKALFGNKDPMGQLVKFDNGEVLKVTGVLQDPPSNSTLNFQFLVTWKLFEKTQSWLQEGDWGNFTFQTFVEIKPISSAEVVNKKIKNLIAKYDPANKENKLFLHPLNKWHLYSEFKNGVNVGGKISYVRFFLFLALGILIIACINFLNLSTARSEKRAREVGVRKTIGAARISLIKQFLGESLTMAFFSLSLAIFLVTLLLPYFNTLTEKKINIPFDSPVAWAAVIGITIVTGLLAGIYPALFLSSFNPVKVLKGTFKTGTSALRPRQILVVTQFAFATALILSTILIYKQIQYIKDRPVGYDKNGLVQLRLEGKTADEFDRFRSDVITSGAAIEGCKTSQDITSAGSASWGITWPGQLPGEDKIPIDQIATTYHFTSTFSIKLLQGRDFSEAHPADSSAIILNESAVRLMRLKNPIGQTVKWHDINRTVVGVFKDFVWGSPYEPTKPMIVGFFPEWAGTMTFRLNPNHSISNNLTAFEKVYKQYNQEYPFEYHFIDENFEEKFQEEKLLGILANWFAGLAILVSCLGLFGLAAFSAEQRTKEIGIRKILGAGVFNLWFHLSKEFLKLVSLALIIGSSVAWYFMNDWLSKYTFRTGITIWVFAGTAVIALLVALITVGFQSIRAALANPVKSLRTE